jgi:hypothetical protein
MDAVVVLMEVPQDQDAKIDFLCFLIRTVSISA